MFKFELLLFLYWIQDPNFPSTGEDHKQDGEGEIEDPAVDSDIEEEETRLFSSLHENDDHGGDEHTDSQLEEMCTPSIVDVRGAVNATEINTSNETRASASRAPTHRTTTSSTPEQKQEPSPPAKRSSPRSPAKDNTAIDRKSYPLKKRFKENGNDQTILTATTNPSKPLVLTLHKRRSSKTLEKHETQVAPNKPSTSSKINSEDDDDDEDIYIDLLAKSANGSPKSKTASKNKRA